MKKDMYFYWGNDTMSYMRYMTLYSFCKLNKDWQAHLIMNKQINPRVLIGTVEKQDKTEYKGLDYSNLINNLDINIFDFQNIMINLDSDIVDNMSDVHIKDILNWKILAEWGGAVADMDILFRIPMGHVIDEFADISLVCFDGNPQKDYIPVSFMYSSGNNRFFKQTYENALRNYDPSVYESCGTLCIQEKNIREIKRNYSDLCVQKLNDAVVFPFIDHAWGTGINMLYNGDYRYAMRQDAVGVHWYAGAPLSQAYNNVLDAKTVHKINNTISMIIRELK